VNSSEALGSPDFFSDQHAGSETGEKPVDPIGWSRVEAETFIRQFDRSAELPSTNDRAVELVREAVLETPLLVWSDRQTSGRGRGANRWWSAEGALTFSVVLSLESLVLPASRWPKISLTAGVAVCRALSRRLPRADIGLKWPNDVFLGEQKVCGILTEVPGPGATHVIIGIGVNVNNSLGAAPVEVRNRATSLYDLTLHRHDRTEILIGILQQLETCLNWLTLNDGELEQSWEEFCLLRGRWVRLRVGEREVEGQCGGVQSDGSLLLTTSEGLKAFSSGIVLEFRNP
jgi:BirA family transcriptional regulator, biotin operon repressor / biotin---[acetyl-CoA-carboxylase] ligase